MKKLLFLPALLGLLWLTACKDADGDGISLFQSHDENEIMSLMHVMAAEMDAMTPTNDPDQDWLP